MKIIRSERNNHYRKYALLKCCASLAIVLLYFSSNAQTATAGEIDTYDYDSTLKGGYRISFKVDDSLQYLFLKKADKTIAELSSTSKGMLFKNLGYIGADFTDYFVLVHSFGSGNPNYIELIRKKTGDNVLSKSAAWIDANEEKQFLLYSDNDVPSAKDKMILYNVKTKQKQFFNFPADIFTEPQVLNRIQIQRLTDKQLVIKYDTEKGAKTKIYPR